MTYLQHFALTRYPFQTPAETDELFPAQAGIETQTRLQHLLELRGIGLLTGEVGCGKTTACRQFAASLHPGVESHIIPAVGRGIFSHCSDGRMHGNRC